jgi:hypothetical protein
VRGTGKKYEKEKASSYYDTKYCLKNLLFKGWVLKGSSHVCCERIWVENTFKAKKGPMYKPLDFSFKSGGKRLCFICIENVVNGKKYVKRS